MGGAAKVRLLWRHYFPNTQGVIFVVDSNDRDRIDEARRELSRMLSDDELKDAVFLVFANKQDLPSSLGAAELTEKLGLLSTSGRNWHMQGTCAINGNGLYEGLDWLAQQLNVRN